MDAGKNSNRKVMCRYGRGCTHMNDPAHREKFWHPHIPSIDDEDKSQAKLGKVSLLYGELLPRGANKAFGKRRLNAKNARSLFDMGMGTGKIVLQAFLQFFNLKYCFGVELSEGRYKLAEEAILSMVDILDSENFQVFIVPGRRLVVVQPLYDSNSSSEASSASISFTSHPFLADIFAGRFSPEFAESGSNCKTADSDVAANESWMRSWRENGWCILPSKGQWYPRYEFRNLIRDDPDKEVIRKYLVSYVLNPIRDAANSTVHIKNDVVEKVKKMVDELK